MTTTNTRDDLSVVERYADEGFVTLETFFRPEETKQWQLEADRLCQLPIITPQNMRADYRDIAGVCTLERLDPLVDISPIFQALSTDERILKLVGQLLGDDGLLFKDRLIFKRPGMTGYVLHQDAAWWQGFPVGDIVNLMIPLDTANAENGALEVFPIREKRILSTPGEIRHMTPGEAEQVVGQGTIVRLNPGDLFVFSSFTPHRSGPNLSNQSRRQLYFTYSAGRHGSLYLQCREHYQYHARVKGNKDADRLYFE